MTEIMDSMDALLIEQALNYHGEQLQNVWESNRSKDELAILISKNPCFEIYEQREKTLSLSDNEKRLKLQKFIAKKADVLYDKSNLEHFTEPVNQQTNYEVAYGIMPGLDSFVTLDKSQRIRNLLESLIVGDVIYAQVMGKSAIGLLLKVLCSCSDCPRVVPELNVKTLMLNSSTVPAIDKKGVTREYMVKDLVCVCVSEVNIEAERVIASMNVTPRESVVPHPPLGLIDASDLPDAYRRVVENKEDNFELILKNSPGFGNPNNIKLLSDLVLLGQNNYSNMIGLRGKFPSNEYGVALREEQSSKWAFRNVTEGIDHFQEGRHSKAFKCLNNALFIDPLNVDGLVARGCLFTTTGSLNKAIDDFETAMSLNESHTSARKYLAETLVALGRNYVDEKQYDNALETFKKCLNIDPCHEVANKEIEYLKLGRIEEDDQNSLEIINVVEPQTDSVHIIMDKKRRKRRKLRMKKRQRWSSTSSSSSSDSSQSESSTSSSSNESRSTSESPRKDSPINNRASLSPLSKRMSMYNILPEANNELLDLESPMEENNYELKVRQFLDNTKDDSDYEDKVRIFFKTAARWKMEREKEKKHVDEKSKRRKKKGRKTRAKEERKEKVKKKDRKRYKARKKRFENIETPHSLDLQKLNSNHSAYFAKHESFADFLEEDSQSFFLEPKISSQSASTSYDKLKAARPKIQVPKGWEEFSIDTKDNHKKDFQDTDFNKSSKVQKQMHCQPVNKAPDTQSPSISPSLREKIVPAKVAEKAFSSESQNNFKSYESSQNNGNYKRYPSETFSGRISEEKYFKRFRSRSSSTSSSSSSRFRSSRRSRSRSVSGRSKKSGSFGRKYSRSLSRSYSRSPSNYRSRSFSRSRSRSDERKYYKYKQSRVYNPRGGRYNPRFQRHSSNYRGGQNFQNGNRFNNGQDNRYNHRRGFQHNYNNHSPNYRGRGNQHRGGRFFHNNRPGYREFKDNRQNFRDRRSYSQERRSHSQEIPSNSKEQDVYAREKVPYV